MIRATHRPAKLAILVAALPMFAILGCATEPVSTTNYTAPPSAPAAPVAAAPAPVPAAPAAAPAPPTPVAFETAVVNAATTLFGADRSDVPRVVVIDPLIDGANGQQTVASRQIETRIRDLAREKFPGVEIREFTPENVAQKPIVLVGTFTGITLDNKPSGTPEAYRICLALADLASNKIVAKGVARALVEGVNVTPTPYYADAPVWVKDASVDAYIKTCQGTRVGDPIDPVYRERIETATLIADAILAYDRRDFARALRLYAQATAMPTGDQLRVHSGLYLTNWKLGRKNEAEQSFGRIVDHGLAQQRLAVKFLFRPGGTDFWPDEVVSGPYPLWLRQIATRIARTENCVEVVGHTSRSGSEVVNDRISLARAQAIKRRIDSAAPALAKRTQAKGVGFRENIVGSGADNLTDLQDRRVEFKLTGCQAAQ
jgi:outer membrane protein OmpA-like peptidoglycan-associated protein